MAALHGDYPDYGFAANKASARAASGGYRASRSLPAAPALIAPLAQGRPCSARARLPGVRHDER